MPYLRRVADTTERDAITGKFYGMAVFVVATGEIHNWNGTTWDVTMGGAGSISPDVLIDCGTITAPSENTIIDAGTII